MDFFKPWRHSGWPGLTKFIVAILAALVFSSAAQASSLTWPASLQAGNEVAAASSASADPYGIPSTSISGVACWSADGCAAVGDDSNATGGVAPIMIPITAGLPGTAVAAPLPTGAAAYSGGDQLANLDAVSCQPSGDCVAVGYYNDGSDYRQPLVVPIVDGVPGTPTEVSPPGEITAANPKAELFSVSCPATGTCLAAGSYRDTTGLEQAFVVPVSGGVPQAAREIALVAGDRYDPDDNSSATGPYVSCWASGSCVLAGQYLDADENDHEFVSDVTDGVPAGAVDATLPNDAQPDDFMGGQIGGIFGLSCASSGDCVAVGYYSDSAHGQEPLVVRISDGQSSTASAVTLPSGARTEAQTQFAYLDAVDCPAAGACVAVGSYVNDTNPADYSAYLPLVVEISASGAATSLDPRLPSNAASEPSEAEDFLDSVSCPVAGSCVATGLYQTTTLDQAGLVAPVSGHEVEAGQELALPADGTSNWGVPRVACASSGSWVNRLHLQQPATFGDRCVGFLHVVGLVRESAGGLEFERADGCDLRHPEVGRHFHLHRSGNWDR